PAGRRATEAAEPSAVRPAISHAKLDNLVKWMRFPVLLAATRLENNYMQTFAPKQDRNHKPDGSRADDCYIAANCLHGVAVLCKVAYHQPPPASLSSSLA